MRLFYVDAETYCDLDLESVGSLRFSRHSSLDVLVWSVYQEGWPEARLFGHQDVQTIFAGLDEPVMLVHWGAFDRVVAEAKARPGTAMAKFRPSSRPEWPQAIFYGDRLCWVDLRQRAQQVGAPAQLAHAAAWVGAEKLPRILTFSKPRERGGRVFPHDDPERWQRFLEYAARDTEVLPRIAAKIDAASDPGGNARGWRVVERMNMRGFPVDRPSIALAQAALAAEEPALLKTFARLTGGLRPTQAAKVAAFLGLPNCQKDTILDAILTMDRPRRRVAQIRLETGSATRHKLSPLETFAGPGDDRCRYQFDYFGAWTRRLTAHGTQPQNFHALPEHMRAAHLQFFEDLKSWQHGTKIFDAVKQHIRGFVKAPAGRTLLSVDFSQIELRVMAWLAGEHWLLDALKAGTDVYRITAGGLYGMKPAEVDKAQRDFGKMVELASQFGLSPYGKDGTGGLYARAKARKIPITLTEADHAIQTYRKMHPKIVAFWAGMQEVVTRCILRGGRHKLGRIVIEHTQPDLIRIIRPSGHFQCLWDPEFQGGEYRGRIEYTGKLKNGMMGRVGTYGARLAQGTVQGTAADMLLEAMELAENAGFPPVMSVHDEIVAEVDADGRNRGAELGRLLSENQSEWSKGVPIVCDDWQEERFQ